MCIIEKLSVLRRQPLYSYNMDSKSNSDVICMYRIRVILISWVGLDHSVHYFFIYCICKGPVIETAHFIELLICLDDRSNWLVAPPLSWAVPPKCLVHTTNQCRSVHSILQPSACEATTLLMWPLRVKPLNFPI